MGLIAALCLGWTGVAAQRVVETFRADTSFIRLARAPVLPFSETVVRNGRPFDRYQIRYLEGEIWGFDVGDSIVVSYLPDPEPAPKIFFSRALPKNAVRPQDPPVYIPDTLYVPEAETESSTLKTSGSLARSFTVGTDRDLA
ncbi:MAG: hypothetical protein RMM53_11070, partial [Bacteroidia bacterium]|nr:hypothetical protein [Bacteroidia bacterium]MDW8334747.1 hypothetical protein [Bacteroidia bacterium]